MGKPATEYFMRFKLSQPMGTAGFKHGASPALADDYVAYRTGKERRLRLQICPLLQYWRRMEYSKLFEIGENGLGETELLLGYPTAVVQIRGRNLKAVADEIAEERCELIQAFDERRWHRPADTALPFIDSISILVGLPAEDAAATQTGAALLPKPKPVAN